MTKRIYRKKESMNEPNLSHRHDQNRLTKQKLIRLSPDFKQKAEVFAENQNMNFSELVQKSIQEYAIKFDVHLEPD